MIDAHACYAAEPLRDRIWRVLGFRFAWVEFGDDPPGLHHRAKTETRIHFDFVDRLRLLLFGDAFVIVEHRLSAPVEMASRSAVSVLPPGNVKPPRSR